MKIKLLIFIGIFSLQNSLSAFEFSEKLLLSSNEDIKKFINDEGLDAKAKIVYLTQIAQTNGNDFAPAAICQLWQNGQEELVRKLWWQSKSRATRMTIVAVILSQDKDLIIIGNERENFKMYSERFKEEESKERLEEIEESKKYKITIKQLVNQNK